MLVVTVEVWPGDDVRRRRVIGQTQVVNESKVAENSVYSYYVTDESGIIGQGKTRHYRSEGAWELVRKVLDHHRLNPIEKKSA